MAFRFTWLWLLLLIATGARAERRFALLVGANEGWATDRPLRYAHDDATRMQEVLLQLGSVAEADATVLLEPSTTEVLTALQELEAKVHASTETTLLFFYYSGHSDASALHLKGPTLELAALADRLSTSSATLTLAVVDSCRSGAMLNTKGATPVAAVRLVADEPVSGFAWLSSSGADELAQESKALAGSIFTHHWVSALRGAGDTDGDGVVRLSEAYGYAYERTRADTESGSLPQRPGFRFNLKGQGDVGLTRLLAAAGTLELEIEPSQRYVVVDSQEQRLVAEARSAPTERRRLQLAAGSYRIKRPKADRIDVAEVTLQPGTVLWAQRLEYRSEPVERGLVKGSSTFSEWAASGRLAEGDVEAALSMFDRLLLEDPSEARARRGKARALLAKADEERSSHHPEDELKAIDEALKLDPSFATDPSVARFAERKRVLEADVALDRAVKQKVEDEVKNNPRAIRRWGLGFELVSTKGILVLEGSFLPVWWLWLTLGVDLVGPGIDVTVKVVPFVSSFSPTIAIGGHYGFDAWGLSRSSITVNGEPSPFGYSDIWGTMLHADVGIQWMAQNGFMVELGGGPMLFFDKLTGAPRLFGFANLGLGIYFH